nr:hypothetical protein [Wolbachia endosymbiont of Wuchereria bancrofti]
MLKDKIDVELISSQKFDRVFPTACLTANQNFSTGFKLGEHGSKNKILYPTVSINFLVLSDL